MFFIDENLIVYCKDGIFFDFATAYGSPKIFDYRYFDREIVISADGGVEPGGVKKKQELTTIAELKLKVRELVSNVRDNFYQSIWEKTVHEEDPLFSQKMDVYFNIKDEDVEFLVNQLVFDILYDKYKEASCEDVMTLHEYCAKHAYYWGRNSWVNSFTANTSGENPDISPEDAKEVMYRMMKRHIKRELKALNASESKELYAMSGIDISEDIDYFISTVRKPKITWDFFFHRGNNHIVTSRQYRRNFVLERESDYGTLAKELNDYDEYVKSVITKYQNDYSDKAYFCKSMEFYTLEMQSRLDFMYKLACLLEGENISSVHKMRFLIEDFTPEVVCPYILHDVEGNSIQNVKTEHNYYFPFLLIEKTCVKNLHDLLSGTERNPFLDEGLIVEYRAKVYELFKYHYVFISEDYKDISDFMRNSYDVLSYHDKNKLWKDAVKSRELTREQKMRLEFIVVINNLIFPKLGKWSRSAWRNPQHSQDAEPQSNTLDRLSKKLWGIISEEPKTEPDDGRDKIDEAKIKTLNSEECSVLFGMDKETFVTVINILEDAFKNAQSRGGGKRTLTALDKLIITIEYRRKKRSMKSIAADYGVAKSQIHSAVKWVEKILSENDMLSLTGLSSK